MEEDIWRQRAKALWETQGDRGTHYFHTVASSKRRSNTIQHIEFQGAQYLDQKTKAQAFFQHYKELMGT